MLVTNYAGRDLASLMEEGKLHRIGQVDRLRLVRQLASAVDSMNERGIQHNDLKSDNLCITDTGSGYELCVIDFGLATTEFMRQ